MKKYFVIKNYLLKAYYSHIGEWDVDLNMAKEFETKEEAVNYGDAHSLGFCVIEEFYSFS